MAIAVGILSSDPNLLRCEVARLRGDLVLSGDPDAPLGVGWYAEDAVLLQRYSAKVRPESLELLGGVLESDAMVVHSAPLPVGMSLEENTQPFRYRSWMFANHGAIHGAEKFRARAEDALPEHLLRAVRGATLHELAFALFLSSLRETGRTDDAFLEAEVAARALGAAARQIEQLSSEAGARPPSLAMLATNNRVLVAARLGEQPLHYRLLEGSPDCDVCVLDRSAEMEPARRAHLRRKTVVIATHVRDAQQWIPVESGEAIAVGRNLHLERLTF